MDPRSRNRKFVCPSCRKPTAAFNGTAPFMKTQVITHLAHCSRAESEEEAEAIFVAAEEITQKLLETA
jgi:hypothetical protein